MNKVETIEKPQVENLPVKAPVKVEEFPEEPRRKFEFPRFKWWMDTHYLREDFVRGNANACLLAKWAQEDLGRNGSVGGASFSYEGKNYALPKWAREVVSSFDGGDPLPNCVGRAEKIYSGEGEQA